MADPRIKTHPVTMNMRQSVAIKLIAQRSAEAAGVTLTDWVAAAIAEKAGRRDLIPPTLHQEVIDLRHSA